MRLSAISLVMLLLLAALVPIGSSQKVQQIPISEGQCGLESYSEMVQIAFEREAQIETDITNSESLEGDWLAVISGACKEDSNLAPYVSNILGADSFKHSIHLDGLQNLKDVFSITHLFDPYLIFCLFFYPFPRLYVE